MSLTTLTFGCRLNAAESHAIKARAESAGLDDAILVNTCAVTEEAVRQARQAIRRARREQPEKRIVVTGCAAQTEPEAFAQMPEVDLVLGNAEKFSPDAYRVLGKACTSPLPLVGRGLPADLSAEALAKAEALERRRAGGGVTPAPSNPSPSRPFASSGPATLSPQGGKGPRATAPTNFPQEESPKGDAAPSSPHRGEGGSEQREEPGEGERSKAPLTRRTPDGVHRPLPLGERNGLRIPPHEKIFVSDIFAIREAAAHMLEGFGTRHRAFVQVQNGCDHRCTFCIIPFGRGNSRSVPMGAIVDEIRRVVARGFNEVVLTGVDITSYGADLPGQQKLGALVRIILKLVPELPRLRLSSIDSIEADADLLRALAEEERLMPHLHLSLQSGDDMILKRMKRRHSRADTIRFCNEARKLRPDVVFGADLIAGFPTETEAMFSNTRSIVEECGITFLHVFPFSPRKGTPAARMPQLPTNLIRARAKILREQGEIILSDFLSSQIGEIRNILVEKNGFGRTEHYAPVAVDSAQRGTIVSARIAATDGKRLAAHALRAAA